MKASMRSCDPCQIIAWGTSFAGMHVLELAISDNRLAAAVAQAPLTDGPAAAMMSEPKNGTRLFGLALLGRVGPVWPPAGHSRALSAGLALPSAGFPAGLDRRGFHWVPRNGTRGMTALCLPRQGTASYPKRPITVRGIY
jgi:hypothetical protein